MMCARVKSTHTACLSVSDPCLSPERVSLLRAHDVFYGSTDMAFTASGARSATTHTHDRSKSVVHARDGNNTRGDDKHGHQRVTRCAGYSPTSGYKLSLCVCVVIVCCWSASLCVSSTKKCCVCVFVELCVCDRQLVTDPKHYLSLIRSSTTVCTIIILLS